MISATTHSKIGAKWIQPRPSSRKISEDNKALNDQIDFFEKQSLAASNDIINELTACDFPIENTTKQYLTKVICSFLNRRGARIYLGIKMDLFSG